MSLPTFAKAIVAGVVSAAAPVVTSALAAGGITTKAGLLSAVFAVVGGAATYRVPNGQTGGLAGYTVVVKTDADEFVRTFLSGLPALVGSSMKAALVPQPSPQPSPPAVQPSVLPSPIQAVQPPVTGTSVSSSPGSTVTVPPAPVPPAAPVTPQGS